MSCKTMKQDENEQNCKKQSTLVVGNKPNGKSRMTRIQASIRSDSASSIHF